MTRRNLLRSGAVLVAAQPGGLDHVAFGRGGVLLVLRGKDPAAHLLFQPIERLLAVPSRMEQLPSRTVIGLILAEEVVRVLRRNGRKHELGPSPLDQDPGKVRDVEPLHGDDDEALRWVVEPAEGGIAEPVCRGLPRDERAGVVGLDRIIDDQGVASASGERAAHGCREPKSPAGRLELAFRGLPGIEARTGKDPLVELRLEKPPAFARECIGEVLGIARADGPGARVAA